MNKTTFMEYLHERYGVEAEGQLTDFLSRCNGRLMFDDRIDLSAMAERYGAPLEIVFCPLITKQVTRMLDYAAASRKATGYEGAFLYAYATKANFSEEVVRTALNAGVNYETSAAGDVVIAHHLWRQGTLNEERYIFCNGSKERPYINAILDLRRAGYERVVPILDDLHELEALIDCPLPLLFGVRERTPVEHYDPMHPGNERFGLTQEEIAIAAERLAGTHHQLFVYHAMIGSQIESADYFAGRLTEAVGRYARLRQRVPSLRAFNFGGGVPTGAYALDFQFDYEGFLTRLMAAVQQVCASYAVPVPDLVGEFGRYTVATHSMFMLEVGRIKEGQNGVEPWYLINGSLMVSLPDVLFVDGQQFITLPLDGWEQEVRGVRLGGRRTCDSDDVFPRPGDAPMQLPVDGEGMILAVFGVGAYQQMISGKGGAHHCLSPEMRRIIIEEQDGELVAREVPQQDLTTIMRLLGYGVEVLEPVTPRRDPQPAERGRTNRAPQRRRSFVRARAARAAVAA